MLDDKRLHATDDPDLATQAVPRPPLDHVADGAADAILVVDQNCRITYANPAAEAVFGMKPRQLMGRQCDDPAWSVFCDGRPLEHEEFACYITLQTGALVRSTERTLRRSDGSEITVLASTSPMFGADGRVDSVICSFADITALKETDRIHRQNDAYNQSLLRLYKVLGRASTYTDIVQALRPEIEAVLNYKSVSLFLLEEDRGHALMLEAGGTVEAPAETLLQADQKFRPRPGEDAFLVLPLKGDAYLEEVAESTHIVIVEDARTDPRTNKEMASLTGLRTAVNVPLILANEKLGIVAVYTYFDEGVRVPTARQIEYLETLANHVAVAMDRVRFLRLQRQAQENLESMNAKLESMLRGVVGALSSTASIRDPYTTQHQERVARLAIEIARELGCSPDSVQALRIAATLHDIGKISVPSEILTKPVALDEWEEGLVRGHPALACQLLEQVDFTHPIATIVRQHHERLDGSGYPDGIMGDEMLLESRILAVADVVEATSSDRPYRPALGIEAALAEIESGAGVKYDADAVAACARIVRAEGGLP